MIEEQQEEYDDILLINTLKMLKSMNEQNTEAGKKFIKKVVEKFFRVG